MASAGVSKLEERLSQVEKAISQAGDAVNAPLLTALAEKNGPLTLADRVSQLFESWKQIENPSIAAFSEKYLQNQELLATEIDMKDLLISTDVKESIILASADDIQATGKLFQALTDLKPNLDKPPLDNFGELEKRLSALDLSVNGQLEQARQVHSQVDDFFNSYNNIVSLMSQNFLLWNSMLSQWEEKLDGKLTKK